MSTPPIIARQQAKRSDQLREGTVMSFTMVAHPPEGFGNAPIQIGLIALDDGTQVLAPLIGIAPQINDRVVPRMRLTRVNEQGLRIYEIAYELVVRKPVETHQHAEFPGYILALTGPSGVGKSTVSKLLSSVLFDYTAPVPILTTRGEKAGDEGEYHYVTVEEFLDLKHRGEIIAFSRIPSATEERYYGYREKDIEAIWRQGKVPVVITEMHLLQGLAAHFGRRSILSCGLLPPGKSRRAMLSQLLHRLRTRGRDSEESIRDRMRNAAHDLQFFENRKELFDHMLVNEDLETVVSSLKGHVLSVEKA